MKILIINSNNEVAGGNDAAALNQLALLRQSGIEVSLFSKNDLSSKFSVEQKASALKYFYNRTAEKELKIRIAQFKPDIIHIHSFSGYLSNSILPVIKASGIPVVLTVHDYKLLCPASACFVRGEVCLKCAQTGNAFNVITNKCNRNSKLYSTINYIDYYLANSVFHLSETVHCFHFVSEFSRQLHLRFKRVDEQKTVMFPNFYFSPKQELVSPGQGYFLYIGRLSEEKGILDFITHFMAYQTLKFDFLIAGSGPLEEKILEMVGGDPRIKLLGFVSGDQKNKLIAEAQYVVLPAKWHENNPISLIESLSFGTPVLAANAGGIPEIVTHGVEGFLFEWKSRASLLNMFAEIGSQSPGQYGTMRFNAIEKYKTNYTPDIFLKQIMALYERLAPETAQ